MSEKTIITCDGCGIEAPTTMKGWFELGESAMGHLFLKKWHFCSLDCLKKAPDVFSKEHGNGGKS
jgi:hypothetical protein